MTTERHPGLVAMRAEMNRQCEDALRTLDANGDAAAAIADSARQTGMVVLYGMGGSHHVNTIAEPLYRTAGPDCRALVPSDVLLFPLPDTPRTALVVSQSGRSGEVVQMLDRPAGREERFALTLDGSSPLARAARTVVLGAGGPEQAFAATRSIVLTVAMHAAVLAALGLPQDGLRRVLAGPVLPDAATAATALDACDAVVFAGYGVMRGVAHSGALSMMELARVPTIGFEGGQFRHGPFEMLRPGLGVLLVRSAGPDRALVDPVAAACVAAGCTVVVADCSGIPPLDGCTTLALPPAVDLAAATMVLLAFQELNIALALRRIPAGAGTPLRTSKVTV